MCITSCSSINLSHLPPCRLAWYAPLTCTHGAQCESVGYPRTCKHDATGITLFLCCVSIYTYSHSSYIWRHRQSAHWCTSRCRCYELCTGSFCKVQRACAEAQGCCEYAGDSACREPCSAESGITTDHELCTLFYLINMSDNPACRGRMLCVFC